MISAPARRLRQVATFMRKESVEVLRQPRLLFTMVFGPFLIMAVFGIGYRDSPQLMRTVFVAPPGSPFLDQVETYAADAEQFVEYAGTTTDPAEAQAMLLEGDVDLVVTFPDRPLDTVLGGQRAPITVVHTRLDPIERTTIFFASRLSVDQINARILAEVVAEGQQGAQPANSVLTTANDATATLAAATGAGDQQAAAAAIDTLDDALAQLDRSVRTSSVFSAQYEATGGASDELSGALAGVEEMRIILDDVRGATADPDQVARLQELLGTVSQQYDRFTDVDPNVLARPFESQVSLAVDDLGNVTDWYAPAAVVLMLQQFGVAFGALTFVRERQLGIVEVFRVAPVRAFETLIGKYLAYLLIGAGIGAVLTALVVTLLDVPLAGNVGDVALVMALTLFASIGVGFVISLAASNDAQAVQYTMIFLLASLFFSGFFLALGQLEGAARVVSWMLPVTYGMRMLRDVMLRGTDVDTEVVAGLAAYGAVMFLVALLAARRRMSTVPA